MFSNTKEIENFVNSSSHMTTNMSSTIYSKSKRNGSNFRHSSSKKRMSQTQLAFTNSKLLSKQKESMAKIGSIMQQSQLKGDQESDHNDGDYSRVKTV